MLLKYAVFSVPLMLLLLAAVVAHHRVAACLATLAS